MTLPVRGARPLGRGGAFTAGVDDGHAIVYNPAGLADIDGISVLVDAGLVLQRVNYARVDSGGNPHAAVDGAIDILPIPTAVLTWKPKRTPWLTLAGGVWVPYLGLNSWPENGPQRYSAISLQGSLLIVMELAAAFRVHEHVWLGVGLQNMILKFKSRVMLHACTNLSCAPEDPSFDSLTELDVTSGFTPSGIVGMIVHYPKWRAGLSFQLPFFVRGDGNVYSRLPTDPMFAATTLNGTGVGLGFDIAPVLRAGFEYRPLRTLRLALDVVYEAWQIQKSFTIQPRGIYLDNVPGIGRYYLSTMYVVRQLQDSVSLHLGTEWEAVKRRLVLRFGYLFESSATPDRTASVLTPDGLKNALSLGLGLQLGPVRLDVGYAHIFVLDRTVTNSESLQLNPINPPLSAAVGNGTYRIDTDIVALGLEARF